MKKTYFFLFIFIISLPLLYCQTNVPGGTYSISEIWTVLNQPYIVQGDVTFTSGTTLTIEAGVEVKFVENADLNILGGIIAIGTLSNPILFYSDNSELKWEGLHITCSNSSELTYCDITDSDNGGLIISNSTNIDINYCNIHHNISEEGGGITVKEGSQYIDILSNEISNNSDYNDVGGTGILCINSYDVIIDDNEIHDNVSSVYGGGIHLITCNNSIISNNNIMFNSASTGAGLYVDYGSDNFIQSNDIYKNTADYSGGGVFLKTECNLINNNIYNNIAGSGGGGVYADSWNGDREFRDNKIYNNTTTSSRGGGILMYGMATIDNCEIYSNTAGDAGGGIHCCIMNPVIINCKIYDNTSNGEEYGGGGISVFHSNPTIIKTEISNNHAELGAGIFINDHTCFGGQIDRTIIDRCTITGNEAETEGGGLYVHSVNSSEYSLVDCKNTVIYNNDANTLDGNEILIETYYGQVDESYITYNCIEPNGLYVDGNQNIVIVENNIGENPLFENQTLNNFNLTLPSPCIDAGDPMSQWDPDDTIADIGCYYYDHSGYDIHVLNNGYNWESFAKLDRDETINEEADIVLVLNNSTNFTPFNFTYLAMETNDDTPYPELEGNGEEWDPLFYDVRSSWLCKIMMTPEEERVLKVYGERLLPDFELNSTNDPRFPLAEAEYHWLGYWLQESKNIQYALEDYWDDVERVKAEDWYYDRCTNNRGGDPQPVSLSTVGKVMEYGKGYMIWFREGTGWKNTFHWGSSGTVEEPETKAESENFIYTELPDYEVIDVVDIPENVVEIAVFQEEICVGAVVVTDSCEQILVYSDNISREPVPFNFEIVTNNREMNFPIKTYQVFNKDSGEFENGYVISGQQESSVVMFGKIGEPQNKTPGIDKTRLNSNYPNPFNPETNISFSIPTKQKITLTIYNLKGQKVRELVSGQLASGLHSVVWEGKDDNGKSVSSGLYFYKLRTDQKEISKKMLLLK